MITMVGCVIFLMTGTGCGSIGSLNEDWENSGYNDRASRILYSGVRADLKFCLEPGDCMVSPGLIRAIMLVDMPFCVCADSICLPYTIYRRLAGCAAKTRLCLNWFPEK